MIKTIKKLFSRKKSSGFNITMSSSDGLDGTFLFDFKNYQSGYRGNGASLTTTFMNYSGSNDSEDDNGSSLEIVKKPGKIAVKPIDVVNELETIPTPWTLSNLQDKIEILEYKRDLITQKYSRREVVAMIERL